MGLGWPMIGLFAFEVEVVRVMPMPNGFLHGSGLQRNLK
jgi:hypothetical protein